MSNLAEGTEDNKEKKTSNSDKEKEQETKKDLSLTESKNASEQDNNLILYKYKGSCPLLEEKETDNKFNVNNETEENIINTNNSNLKSSSIISPRKENEVNTDGIASPKIDNIINNTSEIDTKNNKKIRKDFFGRTIKKKGKQKVSFADEIYILKEMASMKRCKEDYEPPHDTIHLNDNEFKERRGKSSKSVKLDNFHLINEIMNKQANNKNQNNKNDESTPLVEIVCVESYKAMNKKNSYIPPSSFGDTTVCCSTFCLIA